MSWSYWSRKQKIVFALIHHGSLLLKVRDGLLLTFLRGGGGRGLGNFPNQLPTEQKQLQKIVQGEPWGKINRASTFYYHHFDF